MRAPRSSLFRSIPLLLACALAPGCSTGDSGTPLSPEEPPPATSGALELTIHEIGARPDPDGYTLSITFATSGEPLVRAVGPGGGTIHLPDLPLGGHSLRLEGLAEPCYVTGRHPRVFVISAAATTELEVFVSCPGPGAILVTSVTRGSDAGVAGYVVSIEGISTETFPIGASESILVPEGELPEGSRWLVELTGIPDHCWVDRQPDRVGELKGNTVRIEYAVVCIPRGSRIAYAYENTIHVTGGADEASLGISDAYSPSLTPDRTRVAFTKSGDLFVADVDGGGETRLTTDGIGSWAGPQAWSPDGARVVFTREDDSSSDVYVVNVDGSGEVRLTHDGRSFHPSWSPDGRSIAFSRWEPGTGISSIYMMHAIDGSDLLRVVENGRQPTWSPDGSKIAFVEGDPWGWPVLMVVGADGMGLTTLHLGGTTSEGTVFLPTWSPDGTLIAYAGGMQGNRIWMVEIDAGGFGEPFPYRLGTAPSWR